MIETASPATRTISVEEYLRLERQTGRKYEYYNGKIQLMAGGSIPHNTTSGNAFAFLHHLLLQRPEFQIFNSDQKIYLPKYHFYVYADAFVVAGEPVEVEEEADAIVNPVLIVETLSSSTQRYDKKAKFEQYKSLPSFREYVLLCQDEPRAFLYFKGDSGIWSPATVVKGLDKGIWFQSIEVSLAMSAIYYKVKFEK